MNKLCNILIFTFIFYNISYCTLQTHKRVVRDFSELDKFVNETLEAIAPGICYEEVPTNTLFTDADVPVPAGNGSDPSLSKIQVCCKGYERHPHIFKKCLPICTVPCKFGICTGPDTCVCFPNVSKDEDGSCGIRK